MPLRQSIAATPRTYENTCAFEQQRSGMTRKYFRITEVVELCGVNREFIRRLEREHLIRPLPSQKRKLYSLDQVDRVRVARLLIEDMGVNIEGAEVALNMREQMMAMQRQLNPNSAVEIFTETKVVRSVEHKMATEG